MDVFYHDIHQDKYHPLFLCFYASSGKCTGDRFVLVVKKFFGNEYGGKIELNSYDN
jgi:hypothetical protein